MSRFAVIAILLAGLLAACSRNEPGEQMTTSAEAATPTAAATSTPTPAPLGTESSQYADPTNWLCRPAKSPTPCTENLDATAIAADGTTKPDPLRAAVDPPIDCFYVYPTVSLDRDDNSDLVAGEEERRTTFAQAARFASVCRLFVPLYRQVTLAALLSGHYADPKVQALAYGDVLAAWNHYLAKDNQGRGVVLIGHSQGSQHVTRLIREEIDSNAQLRARLVSAIVLGWTVRVPVGADKGGDFANVAACRKPEQVGCVVSYASFSAESPPPPNSLFGRTVSPETEALCVNPAALAGGPGELHPYFGAETHRGLLGRGDPVPGGITTPFVTYPGLLKAECVKEGPFSYLKVTATASTADKRPIQFSMASGAQWGLHVYDVGLSLGDLVTLVGKQAAAFRNR